jgi:hypothetical protein
VGVLQVMSKAQLPLLTSIMMVTQAFLSAPAGIRAKRSIKDRNAVILLGYAAMIAADLTFALVPSVYGKLPCPSAQSPALLSLLVVAYVSVMLLWQGFPTGDSC